MAIKPLKTLTSPSSPAIYKVTVDWNDNEQIENKPMFKTINNQSIIGDGNIETAGESAFDIAVKHGYEGTEEDWILSLKGTKGDSGYTGNLDELQVVNDLISGGETAALSAEMGKQLHEDMLNEEKVEITWDSSENIVGKFISTAGEVIETSTSKGYTTSPFIDISGHNKIYVTATTAAIYGTVFGYDADYNFVTIVSPRNQILKVSPVVIPEGVHYIRVNSQTSVIAKVWYPVYSNRFEAIENKISDAFNEMDSIQDELEHTNYTRFLWDADEVTVGSMLNGYGNVTTGGASGSYVVSPLIDVSSYKDVLITAESGMYGTVYGYDANKNFVSILINAGISLNKTKMDIPENINYIRVHSLNTTVLAVYYPVHVRKLPVLEENINELSTNLKTLENNLSSVTYDYLSWDATQNTVGSVLNLDGVNLITSASTAGFTITPFIDVREHSHLLVTTKKGGIKGTLFGYDERQALFTILVKASEVLDKAQVDIPDEVAYIRFVYSGISNIQYPIYSNRLAPIEAEIADMGAEIETIKTDNYHTSYEYISPGTISKGWLLADGSLYEDSRSYFVSDYIEVVVGNTYYIDANKSPQGITVGCYNSDKTFRESLLALGTYAKEPITIPSGTAYIRVASANTTPLISYAVYSPKAESLAETITKMKNDLYTSYKKINYNEDEIFAGFVTPDKETANGAYKATPFIDVSEYEEIYYTTEIPEGTGIKSIFTYNSDKTLLNSYPHGKYNYEPLPIANTGIKYIRVNGRGVIPEIYFKGVGIGDSTSKKKFNKNVNWVGMSIWWYDGNTLAVGNGSGGVIAKGYQSLLKEQYSFLSENRYCYSGNSLGATAEEDVSCIMNKTSDWVANENAIWTLDTITNDCKRGVPLGTTDDYDDATGVSTYYGALRAFADRVRELSGDDAIVIASNSLRRNNGGLTSTSKNTIGLTLEDYEVALAYACMKNNWWFVDQFRLSALSDNVIQLATIDGLHLNNLGYKMAVIPWAQVFGIIHDSLLGS